jgi:hypothetical protein
VRGAEPDAKSRYARISSNSIEFKKELGLNRNPTGIVQQCPILRTISALRARDPIHSLLKILRWGRRVNYEGQRVGPLWLNHCIRARANGSLTFDLDELT